MEINGPSGTVRLFLNEVPGSFIISAAVVDNAQRTKRKYTTRDRDERPCIQIPPWRFRWENRVLSDKINTSSLCDEQEGRNTWFQKVFLANIIVMRCEQSALVDSRNNNCFVISSFQFWTHEKSEFLSLLSGNFFIYWMLQFRFAISFFFLYNK